MAMAHGLRHQVDSIQRIHATMATTDHARLYGGCFRVRSHAADTVTDQDLCDAELIWGYHQMGHELRPCDVAIGLGSHDLGVAVHASELFRAGMFPVVVFSGATSPTTRQRFPRGEAEHYREHAVELGVPPSAILVELHATNTGANIALSREVLAAAGLHPRSAVLISKPYMQRRAFATAGKVWPELDVVCASEPLSFPDYLTGIGDQRLVVDMLVGDLQRVIEYPRKGFAVEQDVPIEVEKAYQRLVDRGFTSRLLN
jgi:uncharacterized SAM-binding protein YcdF (DUF218 family)